MLLSVFCVNSLDFRYVLLLLGLDSVYGLNYQTDDYGVIETQSAELSGSATRFLQGDIYAATLSNFHKMIEDLGILVP